MLASCEIKEVEYLIKGGMWGTLTSKYWDNLKRRGPNYNDSMKKDGCRDKAQRDVETNRMMKEFDIYYKDATTRKEKICNNKDNDMMEGGHRVWCSNKENDKRMME